MICALSVRIRSADYNTESRETYAIGGSTARATQATQQATQQWFTAASGIVESAASEVITTNDIEHPNIDYIVRVVNRKRQRLRPEDPQSHRF